METPLSNVLAPTIAALSIIVKRKDIFNDTSSDSDEEMEEILLNNVTNHRKCDRKRNTKREIKRQKVTNDDMHIVTLSDDKDFQSHFRLSRSCVETLIVQLKMESVHSKGRPTVPILNALLLMLWSISHQECFRSIGDRFNFRKSHAYGIFIKTCKLVYTKLLKLYIVWPNAQKSSEIIDTFNSLRGVNSFPNVLGCVDSTHIRIPGPQGDDSYYNRKGYPSIILQAICDANMRFIDIYCGWPGSCHNARVWKHSPIFHKLSQLVPENAYLLGDTTYPLNKHLIVPFRDDGFLSSQQIQFNNILNSSRIVIDQAYGRLKGVFRRLKFLQMYKLENTKYIIGTACILHNLLIDNNIEFVQDDDVEPQDVRENSVDNEVVEDDGVEGQDVQEDNLDEATVLRLQIMDKICPI